MVSLKIYAVLVLVNMLGIHASVLAPAPVAVPAVRYGLVAPQNVRPFAAQVSTFTNGLSVYAAPYAAGVLGGPAIVPAPALVPAPGYPAPYAAPFYPPAHAVAPPIAPVAPVAAPAPFLPAPFARSVHAVAPGLVPGLGPHLQAAPLYG